jgi:hypothetical protein
MTDDDLRELGRMVVVCALVEGSCRSLLGALMTMGDEDAAAVAAITERPHSWVLDSLASRVPLRVEDPDLQREWMNCVNDARDVSIRRNGFVHAEALTGASSPPGVIASIRLIRREGKKVPTLHNTDRAALTATADDASNLTVRMFRLMFRTPGVLAGNSAIDPDNPPAGVRTDMVVLGRIEPADPDAG